jgi:hypothetical protein
MKRFSLTFLTRRWLYKKSKSGATIKKSEIKSETFPKVTIEAMAMMGIHNGAALLLPKPTSCQGAK